MRSWLAGVILLCLVHGAEAGPVHEAVTQGESVRLRQLIEANPQALINQPDEKGLTPLVLAIQSSHPECVEILLELGANPNVGKWSPLHEAALCGDVASCRLLLRHKADPNRREHQNQGTPLHVAAFQGQAEICTLLLQAGAKVNLRDGEKLTPYFHARDQHHPEVLKILKAAGGR